MAEGVLGVRLRQAVLVASDLAPPAAALAEGLGLREPFRDPGVAEFGLENAVFALGDCFIEVISPTRKETAAGRYLVRHGGDGGYMVIFDIADLDGARARAAALGVRVVWQIDLPDISGTHLHPSDMCGAIVSLDRSEPQGSWRWGGPQWTGHIGTGAPGRLLGVTIAVPAPDVVAGRWGAVLGVAPGGRDGTELLLDGGVVRFTTVASGDQEGLVEISVETPPARPAGAPVLEIGGVRIRRSAPA